MAYPSWHDLQPPLRTTLPKAGGGRIAGHQPSPIVMHRQPERFRNRQRGLALGSLTGRSGASVVLAGAETGLATVGTAASGRLADRSWSADNKRRSLLGPKRREQTTKGTHGHGGYRGINCPNQWRTAHLSGLGSPLDLIDPNFLCFFGQWWPWI
jgi:hypothetical protein